MYGHKQNVVLEKIILSIKFYVREFFKKFMENGIIRYFSVFVLILALFIWKAEQDRKIFTASFPE